MASPHLASLPLSPSSPLPKLPAITQTPKHHPDCCLSISTDLIDAITDAISDETNKSQLILSIGSGTGLLEALLHRHWTTLSLSASASSSSPSTLQPPYHRDNNNNNYDNKNNKTVNNNNSNDKNNNKNNTVNNTNKPNHTIEAVEVSSSSSSYSSSNPNPNPKPIPHLNRYLPANQTHTVQGTWEICERAFDADTWMFVYPRDPGLVVRYLERFLGVSGGGGMNTTATTTISTTATTTATAIATTSACIGDSSSSDKSGASHGTDADAATNASTTTDISNKPPSKSTKPKLTIIWLGPHIDWKEEYECIFANIKSTKLEIHRGDVVGLVEYESMALIRVFR